MIGFEHLSTRYSKKSPEVLRDVSFTLEKGQIGILLGPNGAGKSTLIHCVLGTMKRYEGNVLIDGVNARELTTSERAKKIAFVPQNPSFSPSFVYDCVLLGRLPHFRITPSEHDHQVVEEVLEEMNLAGLAFRNVLELSGGERQRVAIARALAQQADILLLDEPTSNLDVSAELMIRSTLRELAKKKGLTMLIAVHDLNLALSLGDRFALLKEGRLVDFGGPDTLTGSRIEETYGVQARFVESDGQRYIVFKEGESHE